MQTVSWSDFLWRQLVPSSFRTSKTTTPPSQPPRQPLPSSELYDKVLDMNWEAVMEHCVAHPRDSQFQEGDGMETPLYLACHNGQPPVSVIRALVRAHPNAVHITSREYGDLPLHAGCRARAPLAVLQVLLEDAPHTARQQSSKWGKTPLVVLWEQRPHCLRGTASSTANTEEMNEQQRRKEIDDFWEKMELLVTAVAKSLQQQQLQQKQQQPLLLVHAAVSLSALGCPYPVLEYICDKYPHQVRQRNGSGQLPLHMAVGPTQWTSHRRKYKPREQQVVQTLLRRFPRAARMQVVPRLAYHCHEEEEEEEEEEGENGNGNGNDNGEDNDASNDNDLRRQNQRHPLHIALTNRHEWHGGVQDLFEAAPQLVLQRDPVTQLFPFQLAAIPVGDTVVSNLTTVFELIQQAPTLVAAAAVESARMAGNCHCGRRAALFTRQRRHRSQDRGGILAGFGAAVAMGVTLSLAHHCFPTNTKHST